MLKGTHFSVSKDYPKEIVAARRRLMPRFKAERQNRNNKVSIEYPAKLVVNGKVIADEFADWYPVLEHDRCQLACNVNNTTDTRNSRPIDSLYQQTSNLVSDNSYTYNSDGVQTERISQTQPLNKGTSNNRVEAGQHKQPLLYSQVVSSGDKQQNYTDTVHINVLPTNDPPAAAPLITNVPRYIPASAGNQTSQQGTTFTTMSTMNGTNTTNIITSRVQPGNNVGNNGTATRDQPTYLNL